MIVLSSCSLSVCKMARNTLAIVSHNSSKLFYFLYTVMFMSPCRFVHRISFCWIIKLLKAFWPSLLAKCQLVSLLAQMLRERNPGTNWSLLDDKGYLYYSDCNVKLSKWLLSDAPCLIRFCRFSVLYVEVDWICWMLSCRINIADVIWVVQVGLEVSVQLKTKVLKGAYTGSY